MNYDHLLDSLAILNICPLLTAAVIKSSYFAFGVGFKYRSVDHLRVM